MYRGQKDKDNSRFPTRNNVIKKTLELPTYFSTATIVFKKKTSSDIQNLKEFSISRPEL